MQYGLPPLPKLRKRSKPYLHLIDSSEDFHMTRTHKVEAEIAVLVALAVVAITVGVIRWQRAKTISLRGAVIVQDADSRKQSPIAGVTISAGDLAVSESKSDASGLFTLNLRKPIRVGYPIVLHFRHPDFRPLDLPDYVGHQLYVVRMVPVSSTDVPENKSEVSVAHVRARYTVKGKTEFSVGSAVKTFQIVNKGNIPCKNQNPCSPDGKWRAALGSAALDAGAGNEFREARASCIAGPCPFTRVESDRFTEGGQVMTVLARDWSDTATFLLEAEVVHPMVTQSEHWSYPVIFGKSISFTLPSTAGSVSIEADIDGQTIVFPLSPTLFLSWATCDSEVNPDQGRVFRCSLKPGYRFQ